MANTRMINAQHEIMLFKKQGSGNSVTRNHAPKPFIMKGSFPTRANVIDMYVPPRHKLRDNDKKVVRKEEKSEEMYQELLARFSNKGDLVLEPFAG